MSEWQRKSDEELASEHSTGAYGQVSAIEMMRRVKESNVDLRTTMTDAVTAIVDLKTTLHREEVAIKTLTGWLVGMTAALVVMTGVLIWLTLKLLVHGA